MVVPIFCRRAKIMITYWKILGSFGMIGILLSVIYISFGIPIACGSYGCIRAADLGEQLAYATAFAHSENTIAPTQSEVLTTLMRRYLLTHTASSSSISVPDAVRYRTDVLHITTPMMVQKLGYSSLAQYDELVIVPLLIQEILIGNRNLNNPSELYQQLAQEQWLFLFKKDYEWDKTTGSIIAK